MTYDPGRHHRRSIRLPQYDYTQVGVYFVTICTHERECMLGEVANGVMILNDCGKVAEQFWDEVPAHFQRVAIDTRTIMPNHVHASIAIVDEEIGRGGGTPSSRQVCGSAQGGETPPLRPTLGQIVAYYKYQTTLAINRVRGMPGARFWQRNYWEHLIRDEADLARIRQYIADNSTRWADDQLHPDARPDRCRRE